MATLEFLKLIRSIIGMSSSAILGCAYAQTSVIERHEKDMAKLSSTYRLEIDRLIPSMLKQLDVTDRKIINTTRRIYSIDETPFAFYAYTKSGNSIYFTAGGLTSLHLSAAAASIEHQLLNDDGWWFDYLLVQRAYVRNAENTRATGLKIWAHPNSVLGCSWESTSGDPMKQLELAQYRMRMNMLAFILTHEAGHVVLRHSSQRRNHETELEHIDRMIANEVAADEWALPVLVQMRVNPADIVRALFTHLIIFGGKPEGSSAHQSDLKRIGRVIEVYKREFPGDHYRDLDALVDSLTKRLTPLRSNQSIFDYLNELSESMPFEALHFARRVNRSAIFSDVCRPPEVIPAAIRQLSDQLYRKN